MSPNLGALLVDTNLALTIVIVAAAATIYFAFRLGAAATWSVVLLTLTTVTLGLLFARPSTATFLSELRAVLSDNAWVAVLGLVAVVSGWVAARAAIDSLNRTALDTAANAFLNLRAQYHSDEMRKSIETLVAFAVPIKEKHVSQWAKALRAENYSELGVFLTDDLDRVDQATKNVILIAVRRVASFFDDVGFLAKHSIIKEEDIVRSFINVPGINIYYEVCAPIYAARNPRSPSIDYARLLRKIVPQYDKGMSQY